MKKLYSFLAMAMMSVLSYMGYAQETAQIAYYIKGDYYTLSARSDENPRIAAFGEDGVSTDGFYGQTQVNLADNPFNVKGMNEKNSFFVYLNNEVLENSNSGIQANMFDAQVNFADNDVLKIYDAEPYWTDMYIGFMQSDSKYESMVEVTMDEILPVANVGSYAPATRVLEGTKFELRAKEGAQIANVYVCNEEVEPVDGVYTFYADRAGDMVVVIDMAESAQGMAYMAGELYTFVAQSESNNRIEPINFVAGSYAGEYRPFQFYTNDNPFNLKGFNGGADFYVYLNGELVENTYDGEMHEGFEQQVTFADNDVIKIYTYKPFESAVKINFKEDRAAVCDKVEVVMDEITPVAGLDSDETTYNVLQGTKFQISAKSGSYISKVYVGEEEVEAEDGVFTFCVETEGEVAVTIDVLNVSEGVVFVDGSFYTFTAQCADNKRVEPISITYGTYAGEYKYFSFDADNNPFELRGQNENNSFYVYLNDVEVANSEDGVAANTYMAEVTFTANDVLKVYDAEPFMADVLINFDGLQDADFDNVKIVKDLIVSVDAAPAMAEKALKGTKYEISSINGLEFSSVIVDGVAIEAVDGVYTITVDSKEVAVEVVIEQTAQAVAYVQGSFLNFVVASDANPRVEPFTAAGTYAGDYTVFNFYENDNPFNLKGVNYSDEYYVYIDNCQIDNSEAGQMANIFDAQVELESANVIKIYDKEPFWTVIFFEFAEEGASDKCTVIMDKIVEVEDIEEEGMCEALEGTEFIIACTKEGEAVKVTVDGEEVENVDGKCIFRANKEGEMYVQIDFTTDGIDNVSVETVKASTGIYNMQGMRVSDSAEQLRNLPAGIYIVNGAKVVVR